MENIEEEFAARGSQLIYVLSENRSLQPATADDAQAYWSDRIGSTAGLRVGDGETEPEPRTFDASPFITSNRGFVMVVRRSDMVITLAANYNAEPIEAILDAAGPAP